MSTIITTVNHGVVLDTPNYLSPLTIAASGAVSSTAAGYAISGDTGTVVNYGRIVESGGSLTDCGIYLGGAGSVTNFGTISSDGYSVFLAGGGGVTNSGTIIGGRFGVAARQNLSITNTGTISAGNDAVLLFGGGYVTNSNVIVGANAVGISGGTGTIVNFRTIEGTYGTGVRLDAGGSVTNNGTGIISGGGPYTAVYISGGAARIVNHGTIAGYTGVAFYAGTASQTVVNDGTMIGAGGTAIVFGGGDDVLTLVPGTVLIQGVVAGGGGTDALQFASAAGIGTLTGVGASFVGFAAGTVDAGASWVLAGSNTFGAGTSLSAAGTLTNTGTLTNSGIVTTTGSGVLIDADSLINSGSVGGRVTMSGGAYLGNLAGGVITNGTTAILGQGGANTVASAGSIGGGISFAGTGGNLLALKEGFALTGPVAASGTANTLELLGSAGAPVTVDYNALGLTNFQSILFGPDNNATLKVSDASGTLGVRISGFDSASEIIDLTGIGTNGTIVNTDTANDRLTIAGSSGTLTLQFDNIDGTIFTTTSDSGSGTDLSVSCYCRGTLILTDKGEVAIEDLSIGDRVVTISGEAKPVKWIGHRAYDGRFVAGNREVLPIRVAAGALADGVPSRDLFVSPEHSLYIDGALVAASQLVNGATIVQETTVERLEYFHVELEAHDVIFADGAPAESYVDCDNRGRFQNAAEFAELYPNDNRPRWQFCAPVLQWDSEQPDAIRAALIERAEALGHGLGLDPDIYLIVDGTVVRPESVNGRVYRFALPAGSITASLASRSAVPAEIRADARDRRRLGVPVERLVLFDADLRIEAAHGHAGLCEGFHEDEAGLRWTDGLARLPESCLRSFSGEFTLGVDLSSAELHYRLPPPIRPPGRVRRAKRGGYARPPLKPIVV